MISTSMLLINKVSFTLEASGNDHTLAGIRTLFRFYNSAGNAVRYFCVANIPKDLGKQDPTCLDGLKLLETVDGMLAAQIVAREHQGTFHTGSFAQNSFQIDSINSCRTSKKLEF